MSLQNDGIENVVTGFNKSMAQQSTLLRTSETVSNMAQKLTSINKNLETLSSNSTEFPTCVKTLTTTSDKNYGELKAIGLGIQSLVNTSKPEKVKDHDFTLEEAAEPENHGKTPGAGANNFNPGQDQLNQQESPVKRTAVMFTSSIAKNIDS